MAHVRHGSFSLCDSSRRRLRFASSMPPATSPIHQRLSGPAYHLTRRPAAQIEVQHNLRCGPSSLAKQRGGLCQALQGFVLQASLQEG